MFVITGLPYGPCTTGLMQRMRKPTLDELNSAADRFPIIQRKQDMNVIWHDDEIMQLEFASVAVFQDRRDQEARVFVLLKQVLVHIGGCGDEICFRRKYPRG